MILGRISVRLELMCAKNHAWLSIVIWEKHVSLTLISFKISPNIKELLQISSKTSPKTCSLLNSSGSQTHIFWSFWRKKRTSPFQDDFIFLSDYFLRLRNQTPHGAFYQGAQVPPPSVGSQQSWVPNYLGLRTYVCLIFLDLLPCLLWIRDSLSASAVSSRSFSFSQSPQPNISSLVTSYADSSLHPHPSHH